MLGFDAACVRYFVVHLHSFHAWEACAARGAEETAQLKSECMAQRQTADFPIAWRLLCCHSRSRQSKSFLRRLQERREEKASFAAQQAIGRGGCRDKSKRALY